MFRLLRAHRCLRRASLHCPTKRLGQRIPVLPQDPAPPPAAARPPAPEPGSASAPVAKDGPNVVRVHKDERRLRSFSIDGKPTMVFGMNWGYMPIGENYTYNFWSKPDEVIIEALDDEMRLLKDMHVNVIRQYLGIPPRWIDVHLREVRHLHGPEPLAWGATA